MDNVTLELNGSIIQDSVTLDDDRIRATFALRLVAKIAWGIRQTVFER